MLVPLLIGGYVASTTLMTATSTPTAPGRVATLFGFAIVAGLVVDLVVGPLLGGYPLDKFWLAWAISALTILAVAVFASVLQKLLGTIGTLLTTIVVVLFGNPSGGANGVPYLEDFWRDIGPFLPPRNAYLLLHDSIYFGGSGTTPYLLVLLGYVLVAGIISSLLGWFRTLPPESGSNLRPRSRRRDDQRRRRATLIRAAGSPRARIPPTPDPVVGLAMAEPAHGAWRRLGHQQHHHCLGGA